MALAPFCICTCERLQLVIWYNFSSYLTKCPLQRDVACESALGCPDLFTTYVHTINSVAIHKTHMTRHHFKLA